MAIVVSLNFVQRQSSHDSTVLSSCVKVYRKQKCCGETSDD